MVWKFLPTLTEPDQGKWERHFPSGVGGSAYSSPDFQRMMFREYGAGWQLRLLRVTGGDQELSLPVFARLNRYRRYQLAVHPIAYNVIPIELDVVTTETVTRVLDAVDRVGAAAFEWWLPPWTSWRPADFDASRYGDRLTIGSIDSYAISCDMSYEDHLAQRVRSKRRQNVRTSFARGLEIIESPPPVMVDEYYELYHRMHIEQHWNGRAFSREFFHDVATRLGDGGQLLVMRFENRVVGGGVLLFDRHAVHLFHGTVDRSVKAVSPHAVLYSEVLKRAYGRGLRYVNLGGVNPGNDSLVDFKKSWGAEPMAVPRLQWRCSLAQAGRMALRKLLVPPPLVRAR
jgi:hypothetical protein